MVLFHNVTILYKYFYNLHRLYIFDILKNYYYLSRHCINFFLNYQNIFFWLSSMIAKNIVLTWVKFKLNVQAKLTNYSL